MAHGHSDCDANRENPSVGHVIAGLLCKSFAVGAKLNLGVHRGFQGRNVGGGIVSTKPNGIGEAGTEGITMSADASGGVLLCLKARTLCRPLNRDAYRRSAFARLVK